MKAAPVVTGALVIGVTAVLQHFLLNIGEFHLNELIVPIAIAALNAAIKAIQEWKTPEPTAATRDMNGEQPTRSYAERVLIG